MDGPLVERREATKSLCWQVKGLKIHSAVDFKIRKSAEEIKI